MPRNYFQHRVFYRVAAGSQLFWGDGSVRHRADDVANYFVCVPGDRNLGLDFIRAFESRELIMT